MLNDSFELSTSTMTNSRSAHEPPVIGRWWDAVMKNTAKNQHDDPNYYAIKPEILMAEANVGSFTVGTGDDIFRNMQASIEAAESEVAIITCFWSRSSSLSKLSADRWSCDTTPGSGNRRTFRNRCDSNVLVGLPDSRHPFLGELRRTR